MLKTGLNQELPQNNISLRADLNAGKFRVLGSSAEISISCVSAVSPGVCIDLCGKVQPCGQWISIEASGKSSYGFIESLAIGFTAVVYGCFRRVFRGTKHLADSFCHAAAALPVRCRMAKLAFAGGLRL